MSKLRSAFLWSGAGKISQYAISFVSSVIIARILMPSDFGLIGVLTIFSVVANLLIESGFKDVLIINSKKNDDVAYSSVFYMNFCLAILLYATLYFLAPLIANYFEAPQLLILSRIVFIPIVINSLCLVPLTIFSIELDFKYISILEVLSMFIYSSLGITLAILGYGVWALVIPGIVSSFMKLILIWTKSTWRPKKIFNYRYILLNALVGGKLLVKGLIDNISHNLIQALIGKNYTFNDVGYFNRANNLQNIPNNIMVSSINQVSYPMLSAYNGQQRMNMFIKLLRSSSMISFPISIGLIIISKPLVLFLLTDKWLGTIQILQILSILISVTILNYLMTTMFKLKNKINYVFWISLLKNLILISLLLIFKSEGVLFLSSILVLVNLGVFIANIVYSSIIFDNKIIFYLENIVPFLLCSMVMGGGMYAIGLLIFNSNIMILISQSLLGFLLISILYYVIFSQDVKFLMSKILKR